MRQWKEKLDSPLVNGGDISKNIKNQPVTSGLSGSSEDDKSEKKGMAIHFHFLAVIPTHLLEPNFYPSA